MIKKINQLSKLFQDMLLYLKMRYFPAHQSAEKVILVDFKNPNLYHRFFYLLLKFYQLSGYRIVYPMNFNKFRNLRNGDAYLALILKESGFLDIRKPSGNKKYITITDENFSADYFKNYFEFNNAEFNSFHIPMSFHPLMYHKNIWNEKVDTHKKRVNSIFCYGNFDDKAYLEIDRTNFNVVNRRTLYEFFKTKPEFHLIKDYSDLELIINQKRENKYIFAEKYVYPLPMEKVRESLSNFSFFLCCPGVVMPLCHNVVEAMSVGTIPIIQKAYAEVMYPNLEHNKNAIIFDDLKDLEMKLEREFFSIPEAELLEMSRNALLYYQENLTPESVTEKINARLNKGTVYMNAEHRSVKFVK